MSSYLPPFARMRQIKRDVMPSPSAGIPDVQPRSVDEALAEMQAPEPEPVFVVEVSDPAASQESIQEPDAPKSYIDFEIEDAPHLTQESQVVILPAALPVNEPPPEPVKRDTLQRKDVLTMRKEVLMKTATDMGIVVDETMTKAQIVALINGAE